MERRLQSLKIPRDLTLGGTKPKKSFVPNLNAVRTLKNNVKKEPYNQINHKPVKDKVGNKRDLRNNKKNDKSERYLQSSGVFSEVMGGELSRKARYYETSLFKDDVVNVVPKPKIKKDEWSINTKDEHKVLRNLVAGKSSDEDEIEMSSFAPYFWNKNDFKEKKVKIESESLPKHFKEGEEYSDYNPGLSLWQLPDSLPGKGLSDEPNSKVTDYKLCDMLEGQIGKLKIHQSGKMVVEIGSIEYEFKASMLDTCHEDIISIQRKKQGATAFVLGEVQQHFLLYPNFMKLLKDL